MADTSTTTRECRIKMYFVDGDDRMLTLKDPKANIASSDIASLQTWMQTNQPVVGDKLGAAFGKIISATKITKVETAYDIDN